MTHDLTRIILAIGINAAAAISTYFAKIVSRSGAIGGFFIGALIYYFTDWRGYVVLVGFFVFGTAVTKVRYKEKAAKGIAQDNEGRRGARHAVANCSMSLLLGLGSYIALLADRPEISALLMMGFTAAFATAISDTASSEIGQAYGKTTILLTSFKRVPPGTEGAVSIEGTLAGIVASLIMAFIALACGVIDMKFGWQGVLTVVIAAFIGNTLESVIGSTIEQLSFITNEVTNFINTLIGAGAAIVIYLIIR